MEFLEYGFMKHALVAICIITPLFGMLGTMIVNNRMAFFSDALGHSALTGMAIGVLLGFAGTDLTMLLFALVFALVLNHMKRKSSARSLQKLCRAGLVLRFAAVWVSVRLPLCAVRRADLARLAG